MSKTTVSVPADKLELYEKLIETIPEIERKGKTMPYTSINGHMFSFIDKTGSVGLRLSKEDRETFIKTFDSSLMEQYGRIMKEYVVVPDQLLFNTKELSNWATGCCPFVASDLPQTGSELNVAQAVAVFNFYRRCVESFPTVEQLEEELRSLDR